MKSKIALGLMLLAFSLSTSLVTAECPTMLSVKMDIFETCILVQIHHPDPSSTHYVDKVELSFKWGGGCQTLRAVEQIDLSPQTEETFTVVYELPENAQFSECRVRAHCVIHDWSKVMEIPEFPLIPMVLLYASVTVIVLKSFSCKKIGATRTRC